MMRAADASKLRVMLERARLTVVAEAAAARAAKAALSKQVCCALALAEP
jgi:hypothetical protein